MEKIVEQYKDCVTKIVSKYKNAGIEFDDLFQEGLIALYKAKNTFDEQKGAKFETYLTTLVNNRIIDTIRKNKKDKENLSTGTAQVETVAVSNDLQDEYMQTELVKTINEEIKNHFKKEEYNIWVLSQAYSYKDIAEKLDITTKKVDNILQKIKLHIKTKIKF